MDHNQESRKGFRLSVTEFGLFVGLMFVWLAFRIMYL